MENDAATRKVKDRSPRFPFISLEKALERAARFYAKEKRGSAPFAAAAEHWSYSPSSSGALQTFAALKSYGLLDGAHKSVRLSDLALRILLDKRDDSTEREQLKRQAALSPSIAADINNKWPDGLPSDATLNHYLVLELGFNESTASKVVNIIKQNHTLIASSTNDIQSHCKETNEVDDIMSETQNSSMSKGMAKTPIISDPSKLKIERTHDRDGLDITLQFNGEPTEGTYEYLKDFFEFKLAQMKKAKGP